MADMDVTAKFRADISDMKSKMDQVSRSLDGMQQSTKKAQGGFTVLKGAMGTAFGGAIIGGIYAAGRAMTDFVGGAIAAADESVKTVARLDQIAASMGVLDTVLGGTTQRLLDQAQALQDQTGVSDEVVKGAQAMILTFKSVAETAGETGGVFDRTTQAALDLSAAGFGDVNGQAKALARALEDPMKGLSMLGRSGVTFTDQQKEMINALVEGGDSLAAQNIILQAVESQVGGTAAAMATDADKLKATFADLKEGIGLALFPVLQELSATLIPIIKELQEPLKQVAEVVGGALSQAFSAIAPLIAPLATSLAAIGQAVGTSLAGALQALIPSLVPVAQNLGNLATQIAPILANVLGKLGEVFGRVLGAVTPLLGPLTDLVMGILDAAWPIVEVLADTLMILVDALTPVLDAVMLLVTPLTDLVRLFGDVLTPVLQAVQPVIEAIANVLGQILVKAIGLTIAGLGGLIFAFSKVAPFVLRNVTTPVVKYFLEMVRKVVGAAAQMLGWVPGLGDSLKQAEAAIGQFAVDTERNIKAAGDAIASEGSRIGNEMMTQGRNALTAAGPGLGAAAAQVGRYVAGQYNYAVASGMGKAFGAMGAGPAAPTPPAPPSPTPAPSPSGSPSGASGASKQEDKRLQQIQKFIDGFEKALDRIKTGQETLAASTKRAGSQFASALGDMLPESEVQQAFGPSGSITNVISQYDQLDAAINDLYTPLTNMKRFGKEAAKAARANLASAKSMLESATQTALALLRSREENRKALETAESDYSAAVASINSQYDALDKAAADNIRSIEAKWDAAIPALESALDRANEAFARENGVLQDLIKERDGFLSRVAGGFRSFVNDLNFESAAGSRQIIRETKKLANGITVTLEREIEVGGGASSIREQLQSRLDAVREFSANIRTLMQRGLDPTLVQDFVSAGVSGAGSAAAALASASDAELASINAVQSGLASEVASFQQYASQQWFDAGIAQQEAIVAPLAAARDQAQAALDAANAARTSELNAARAHAEALKVQRQQALDAAKAQYDAQKAALEQQGREIDAALTENANNLHTNIANLQNTVPPEMFNAGKKSVKRMLAGFREEFPGMKGKLNGMMDRLAASMNRTATVTVTTVHRSVFEGAGPDGRRAMGGPVQANKAYLVGERGPEMLIMGARSGNVIPNHELGSVPSMGPRGSVGGNTVINLTVNAGMGTDGVDVGRRIVEQIKRFEKANGPVYVSA